MKLKFRIIALILSIFSIFSLLVACDSSGSPEETTVGDNQEVTEDQTTEVTPNIEKKNYDDTFYLYLENSGNPIEHYWADESNGDVMSAALYARQEEVFNYLGVTVYGWASIAEEDYSEVFKTAVKTKSGAIDTMTTHVSIGVTGLVSEGFLRPFNDMPGIDLEADYWNQEFMDSLAIDDMYLLGFNDFNILFTHVITFNKTLLEKYDAALDKSIYEMVDDREWTLSQMIDLAKLAFVNNGSVDKNQYGFTGLQWVPWCGFLEGCGIKLVDMNDEGNYVVSYFNEENKDKTIKLVGMLKDLVSAEYSCVDYKSFDLTVPFTSNRALMTLSSTNQLPDYLHYDIDFGIVPYPLYDTNQTDYHSLQWGGYIAIPAHLEDEEMVGETLEMLAFFSDDVQVAFYQKLLGKQVADNPDDRRMLEIVWDSVCTDFGQTFEGAANDMLYMLPYVTSMTSGGELTQYYDSHTGSANMSLSKFVKKVVRKYTK